MTILNIILLLLIIGSFYNVLNKSRPNVLNCGIFGFSGREGKKIDLRNLIILGLYNRTRGTDSCGYYYNGHIEKGIDKEADFKDFIVNNKFISGNLPSEILMAHTRKSTYGSHTLENAHPHLINKNYVQTHNGTIKNIWSLCTKHGIPHADIHVDSIGLASIIEKDGFGVLSDYEGFAALTMVFMDDPQILYLYHGASREKENETIYEERPLFLLKTTEGLYYSSMEEPLHIINKSKTTKPETLPHNKVYAIKYGELIDSVFTAKRENNNISKVYTYTPPIYSNTVKIHELPFTHHPQEERGMVLKETAPPEKEGKDVYFRYGRYHKTDYKSVCEGNNIVWRSCEVLLHGAYEIDRKNKIITSKEQSDNKSELYFFIRGIMMRDFESFKTVLQDKKDWADIDRNICVYLSKYSKYPITCYFDEGILVENSYRNAWYFNGLRYDGVATCKFTKRKYQIKSGFLDKISRPENDPEVFNINNHGKIDSFKTIYLDDDIMENSLEDLIEDIDDNALFSEQLSLIKDLSDVIITEKDILLLPEVFILFLEKYYDSYSRLVLNEIELFNETVKFIQHLIYNKLTFLEYAKNSFEKADFINEDLMQEYFKEYSPAELLELPNRYTLQPFKLIEEVIKPATNDCCTLPDAKEDILSISIEEDEISKQQELLRQSEQLRAEQLIIKIRNEFKLLEALADDLQSLDSCEMAQDVAFFIYNHKDKIEKEILEKQTRIK